MTAGARPITRLQSIDPGEDLRERLKPEDRRKGRTQMHADTCDR